MDIKKELGEYLDIEFAIYKEKIYILQARKITTINANNPLILDNSNIVESYPGLSLPLTCSFVNTVYSGVFKGVCKRILKNDKELINDIRKIEKQIITLSVYFFNVLACSSVRAVPIVQTTSFIPAR